MTCRAARLHGSVLGFEGRPLRHTGGVAVPRRRDGRRQVEHLARGHERFALEATSARCAPRPRALRARSHRSTASPRTQAAPTSLEKMATLRRCRGCRAHRRTPARSDGASCVLARRAALKDHDHTARACTTSACARRPDLHAHRADPRGATRAREDRHEDRPVRGDRDQRGICVGRARVGERAPPRHGGGESERRRDRAGPPDRRHRHPADDDVALGARAHGRALRPPDDVRGRRPGERHDPRTARPCTSRSPKNR